MTTQAQRNEPRVRTLEAKLVSATARIRKLTAELAMVRHVNRLYARENEKLIDEKLEKLAR